MSARKMTLVKKMTAILHRVYLSFVTPTAPCTRTDQEQWVPLM